MDIDNKYDQSFKRSETGVLMDDSSDEDIIKSELSEQKHLERMEEDFGGGRTWL